MYNAYKYEKWNVTVLDFADFVEQKTSTLEDSDLEDKPQPQMKIIFDPYVDSLPHDDAEMMVTWNEIELNKSYWYHGGDFTRCLFILSLQSKDLKNGSFFLNDNFFALPSSEVRFR